MSKDETHPIAGHVDRGKPCERRCRQLRARRELGGACCAYHVGLPAPSGALGRRVA